MKPLLFGVAALGILVAAAGISSAMAPEVTGQGSQGAESEIRGRDELLPEVEALLGRFDCLSCHAPESPLRRDLDPAVAPLLEGITRRTSAQWLIRFLEDPRAVRPGTHHPHQLTAIPDNVRASVAEDLVHYLHELDGGDIGTTAPIPVGLMTLERGRELYHSVGCIVCHGPQEPVEDLEYSLVDLSQMEPLDAEFVESESPNRPAAGGALSVRVHELPDDLIAKQSVTDLAEFLGDPLAVRPGGFCPSMSLDESEALAVAAYVLRRSAQRSDGSFERLPGLVVELFEGGFTGARGGSFDHMSRVEPTATGVVRGVGLLPMPGITLPDDDFGLRFSGLVNVPTEGEYTFHLASDDGSRLIIGGQELIAMGGAHPLQTESRSVELEAGFHGFSLEYYEVGGEAELSLEVEGPGFPRARIPGASFAHWKIDYAIRGADGLPLDDTSFKVDSPRAERGGALYSKLGCATCHSDVTPSARSGADQLIGKPPTLEQLSGGRPGVLICLRAGRRYDFEPDTVGLLLSAFVDSSGVASDIADPSRAVERHFTRRNCYGCHRRDGIGGVHPSLMAYFTGDEEAELGDQGRFPPTLTAVGRKLRQPVLQDAVHGMELVRPYLNARMPKIGAENLTQLAERLEAADRPKLTARGASSVSSDERAVGGCEAGTIDAGRRLAGDRGGLGCVQCHGFLGSKSLGIQAVDLGTMHRRLRFGWFRELLLDPASVDLGSRMANVWVDGMSPVDSIEGGDVDAQIRALWCWLGEGEAMAPPPGLDTGPWAFEVDVSEERRLISVFMEGLSPSVLCVGNPEGVHYAFDEEHGRLAKVWRGRFLNATGTWQGRAGALESPGSKDTRDMLPGFAIASVPRLDSEWPGPLGPANPGGIATRSIGRTVHGDGSVTMRYTVGDLRVAETLRPRELQGSVGADMMEGGSRLGLERSFEVRMPASGVGQPVIARVAAARQFARAGTGRWRLNGERWPLFVLDEGSTRTAAVVELRSAGDKATGTSEFGAAKDSRPALDGRNLGKSQLSQRERPAGPALDELRVPLLMVPAEDGSGDLLGTISWSYAW